LGGGWGEMMESQVRGSCGGWVGGAVGAAKRIRTHARTHVHEAPVEVALDVHVVELDGLVHLSNVPLHEPLPERVVQRLVWCDLVGVIWGGVMCESPKRARGVRRTVGWSLSCLLSFKTPLPPPHTHTTQHNPSTHTQNTHKTHTPHLLVVLEPVLPRARHAVLRDEDQRVVVALLDPVQELPEAPRHLLEPARLPHGPRLVRRVQRAHVRVVVPACLVCGCGCGWVGGCVEVKGMRGALVW
jgi:hypothetical protein